MKKKLKNSLFVGVVIIAIISLGFTFYNLNNKYSNSIENGILLGPDSSCDIASGEPCCENIACQDTVCAADPFCCETAWDETCVGEALSMCEYTYSDCYEDHNGFPGCNDYSCQSTVCSYDPYCCNVAWDQICVDEALEDCPYCAKETCTDCYGPGAINCPANSDGIMPNCCAAGEECCSGVTEAPPICCNKETAICGNLGVLASIIGEKANVCKPKDDNPNFCEDINPAYPKECKTGDNTLCCKAEDTCSSMKIGPWPGKSVPICKEPYTCKEGDSNYCGKDSSGPLCCNPTTEECKRKEIKGSSYFYCLPKKDKCKTGEVYCPGDGIYDPVSGRNPVGTCCSQGYACKHQPNGYPKCIKQ